ncbi:uncharacterized protein LOC113227319 [Hyposmocoma kahamanoa]|uniref:uncharacterized protein LOC113227319 n=1 Tax=Hyposmocoma kahamanoa TaxID=1477025 RepID=UPI000E6D84FD|nr:uncharacterized protein LOC113227319 [Hyposmocoma kahamanoa]
MDNAKGFVSAAAGALQANVPGAGAPLQADVLGATTNLQANVLDATTNLQANALDAAANLQATALGAATNLQADVPGVVNNVRDQLLQTLTQPQQPEPKKGLWKNVKSIIFNIFLGFLEKIFHSLCNCGPFKV